MNHIIGNVFLMPTPTLRDLSVRETSKIRSQSHEAIKHLIEWVCTPTKVNGFVNEGDKVKVFVSNDLMYLC